MTKDWIDNYYKKTLDLSTGIIRPISLFLSQGINLTLFSQYKSLSVFLSLSLLLFSFSLI